MPSKKKLAKEVLDTLSKTKFARGAGIAGGVRAAEETITSRPAQTVLGAAEGAALGSALGPMGAVGGAVAGGLLGFVLADGERIIPIDMIAIPAYQYSSMLQGREPTFQVFIKEGEVVGPVMLTDAQIAGSIVLAEDVNDLPKKRKLSAWQRYIKVKKNKIFFKSGKRKGQLNLKAMGVQYRKRGKK
ncbi:MAG: hypothetical protein [Circular genetic element sp.]|nr:MAG: hypothetical protein [Circular genetic element sp.]